MTLTLDPVTARRTHRTVEPVHGMIYFAPEGPEEYGAIGLRGARMGYFASRSAAMGPVPAEVTIATFFNFNPALVRRAIPEAWTLAAPEAVLAARLRAADRALRAVWGDTVDGPEVAEAAALARTAAMRACERPEGRPLFAAHAALPWPDPAHLVLWHAQSLLREFRGDGHVALLAAEGLDGVEALVVHAATGDVPAEALRATRAWSEEQWAAAVERVATRGWLEPGGALRLTDAGRAARQSVEDRTDELAVHPYQALGEDGCSRLRALVRPLSRAIVDAGRLAGLAFDDDEAP
ncbi:MAG TPA: hypothetical protein VFP61_00835 [Acidimicrobiales bacterium]|nr:hypothetical protein [Acidimicrobiales bacterium]